MIVSAVIIGLHLIGIYFALTHTSLLDRVLPPQHPSSITFEFTAPPAPQVSAPGPIEPQPAPMAASAPEQKPVTPPKPMEPKKKPLQKKPVEKAKPVKPVSSAEPAVATPAPVSPSSASSPSLQDSSAAAKPVGTGGEHLSTIPAQVGRFQANNPQPDYPVQARRRHMEGVTILSVRVNEEGGVVDVQVKTSSGYDLLDRSALQTVRQWKFEPGRHGTEAATTVAEVRVRFGLN